MPSATTTTLENAVVTLLNTAPGVTGLATGGIFPDVAPQDTIFPWLVYTVVSDNCYEYMGGDSGINEARVQIDVYAMTSVLRGAIANLLKSALDGLISVVSSGVAISSMFLKDNKRSFENPKNESDTKIYRSMMEFTIWYYDPVAAGGGGAPTLDNTYMRAYSYAGGQLTFPNVPQPYTIRYTDQDGTLWECAANTTNWIRVNTVAQ